jgi:tetratricopeptide (TPR) repeat protein
LVKNSVTNAEAYQLYLQGRYHWNKRTAEDLQQGINYFTQAIERDSTYAPAYSGLADCYLLLNVYDIKPAMEANAKAREAATKALALDETLAEAHASLADVSYRYDWNWAEAEQHFKRAIELNADYATAHQWYSAMLAAEGRFDEANAEARRARELEPFSLTVNTVVGRRLYYARKFDEAQTAYRQTLDMDRNFVRAHVELGDTLMQTGQTAEAIAEFQQALALDKESISARAGLGYAYGVTGQRDKALQLVAQLQELGRRRYVSPYHLAVIHAGLGARTEAIGELEQAAGERYAWLVFLRVEPQFDGLRSDPRFGALVRRVGLVR